MAEFLIDWNVPYVFGLAGSEEVGFLDALVDRVKLQYVQGLHESSVMAMADGYARASGQTAFVQVHSDAGTAYALGQIANAFRDRVPVVITAGGQSTTARGQNVFLEAPNLAQLPRDYTRWTWDVLNAEHDPEVLRRAFLFARVPPGGPTFVTFSKDLWEQRVKRAEILPRSRSEPDAALHPDPGRRPARGGSSRRRAIARDRRGARDQRVWRRRRSPADRGTDRRTGVQRSVCQPQPADVPDVPPAVRRLLRRGRQVSAEATMSSGASAARCSRPRARRRSRSSRAASA